MLYLDIFIWRARKERCLWLLSLPVFTPTPDFEKEGGRWGFKRFGPFDPPSWPLPPKLYCCCHFMSIHELQFSKHLVRSISIHLCRWFSLLCSRNLLLFWFLCWISRGTFMFPAGLVRNPLWIHLQRKYSVSCTASWHSNMRSGYLYLFLPFAYAKLPQRDLSITTHFSL